MPIFSVIIATRNRSILFKRALDSVVQQSLDSLEIIVVDDGSNEAETTDYRSFVAAAARPVRIYSLLRRQRGHGPSYARNFGATQATGDYLCFLDDDDSWTDPDHLTRVARAAANYPSMDLYLSNQTAFLNGAQKPGPIWIEALADRLAAAGRLPEPDGAYAVSPDELLSLNGFCHLNTLVIRRALFEEIGGFDERLSWEEDRDLYLRAIDRAISIRYAPNFVSRHNIPDPTKNTNASTGLAELERRLSQQRVFDKAVLFAQHPTIRAHAKRQRAYTLKRITEILVAKGDYAAALHYARSAWGAAPTMKWTAYLAWIASRSGIARLRST